MLHIENASAAHCPEWQRFVDEHPFAHPMHHWGWHEVLAEASSVKPIFLVAREGNGKVQGILPAYYSNSVIYGSHVSTFEGGVLARSGETGLALMRHLESISSTLRSRYLLVRGSCNSDDREPTFSVEFVNTKVNTAINEKEIWNGLKKKTRWYVRQGEKQKFSVRLGADRNDVAQFYRVYAKHVHRLGTPVFGSNFMSAIVTHLGSSRVRLLLVEDSSEVIGGMLIVLGNKCWLDLYAIIDYRYRDTGVNYLLYWTAIKLACREGAQALNLGRSAIDGGVHAFKRKWSDDDELLKYDYYCYGQQTARESGNHYYGKRTFSQRCWSFLPLSVANRVGPIIRRGVPFT